MMLRLQLTESAIGVCGGGGGGQLVQKVNKLYLSYNLSDLHPIYYHLLCQAKYQFTTNSTGSARPSGSNGYMEYMSLWDNFGRPV